MDPWKTFLGGQAFSRPQEDMEDVARFLADHGARKILDIGCGNGRHAVFLIGKGFAVTALDGSEEALRVTANHLKEKGMEADLVLASCGLRLPFSDGFFDAAIAVQTIQHGTREDIRSCLGEIRRVLKEEGFFFLTVPSDTGKDGDQRFSNPGPFVHIPASGAEKGIPHLISSQRSLKEDLAGFSILSLRIDRGDNFAVLTKKSLQ